MKTPTCLFIHLSLTLLLGGRWGKGEDVGVRQTSVEGFLRS